MSAIPNRCSTPLSGTQRVRPWMLACRVPRHDGPPGRLQRSGIAAAPGKTHAMATSSARTLLRGKSLYAIGAESRSITSGSQCPCISDENGGEAGQTAAVPPRASGLAPRSRAVARWFGSGFLAGRAMRPSTITRTSIGLGAPATPPVPCRSVCEVVVRSWSRASATRVQLPPTPRIDRRLSVATDQRHAWAGDASLDRRMVGPVRRAYREVLAACPGEAGCSPRVVRTVIETGLNAMGQRWRASR